MSDLISNITSFTPNYYGKNHIKQENPITLGFQPKMRPSLVTDVFEKSTNVGVNGSVGTAQKIEELLPYAKIKKFCPDAKETARNKKIEEEKKHLAHTITKRTEYNTKQLRSAGVPERDVKKYLKIDGHVTEEGKRILKEKGKSYQ